MEEDLPEMSGLYRPYVRADFELLKRQYKKRL